MNINTKQYWDNRFATGDWEEKSGREQTRSFAETQVKYFKIPTDFSGTLLDFGCGLGDAIPVYRKTYPHATLVGMDISDVAINKCIEKYGHVGQFMQGDYTDVPNVDVIIASNVFEHLSHDVEIARHLLDKSRELYVVVPYKEHEFALREHVNSYDERYFRMLSEYDYTVFHSRGYSQYGWNLWFNVYLKNLLRPFLGKRIISRSKQIMFHFKNETHASI